MTSPPSISIHQHPKPLSTLAPHLIGHLPSSLSLLRRLQFHAQSQDVRVYATFAPGYHHPEKDQIWTAAFVDRSRAPETECWVFSSVESFLSSGISLDQTETSDKDNPEANLSAHQLNTSRKQLIALFSTIRALGVPDVFASQATDQSSDTLLVGGMHEITLSILTGRSLNELRSRNHDDPSVISGDAATANNEITDQKGSDNWSATKSIGPIKKFSIPWIKFLYPINTSSSSSAPAEAEATQALLSSLQLEWTTVHADEFALVRSRTPIPRKDRTLLLLPSAALRSTKSGELISWAFLGPDGGLSSLYVEAAYRGKGLGKAVASRVMGLLGKGMIGGKGFMGMEGEVGLGREWSFSHTAVDNWGSIGVAKGLGGREGWIEYWVIVDLGSLGEQNL